MNQKIAILITNFEGGGAQKVALTHARAFQDAGLEVKVIALEHQDSYQIPEDLDVTILTDSLGTDSKLAKLIALPTLPFRLARFLEAEDIQLCISHLERADFVNILAKPLAHHKTISVIHSHLEANYFQEGITARSYIYMSLVKLLERFSDRITPVSEGIAQNLIKLGLPKHKIQVINNPFFISEIQRLAGQPLEEYADIFSGEILISIARLSRQKGIWHALKAFNEFKKTHPYAKYVILGDGPLRDHHLELARSLDLNVYDVWSGESLRQDADVYFLGFVQNPFQFLAKADVFLLPSHYEGLPNVIIESLICGTPVIATDSDSGPRELLAPKTSLSKKTSKVELGSHGILIPVPDPQYEQDDPTTLDPEQQEMLKAIQIMFETDSLRSSYESTSRDRVAQYEIEQIIPQWIELIQNLLKD